MRTIRLLVPAVCLVLPAMAAMGSCGRGGSPSATPGPTMTVTASPAATVSATVTPPTTATTPAQTTPAQTAPARTTPAQTTAVPPFPRSLLGKDIERIPTGDKVIALTFDAGANADGVAAILDTLAQKRVTATFFLTGAFVDNFPVAARRIATAGYRVGNHSVDHPHFTDLTDAQIRAQLRGAASTIRGATGIDPAPLFRFPFGDRDARTIAVVNAAGYLPVRWSVDSLGWQGTMAGSRDASFVSQRVLAAAAPGGIVLMHVGSHPTDLSTLDANALPAIIDGLRARGYTFVSLGALLS